MNETKNALLHTLQNESYPDKPAPNIYSSNRNTATLVADSTNCTIYWAKVKPNAIIPTKRDEDGWYDIYACVPENFEIELQPGEIYLFNAGIASAFPAGYRLKFTERGSTGTKGLAVRAGCIDSGYRGEYIVPINNTNDAPVVISSKSMEELQAKYAHTDYILYSLEKAICQAGLEVVPQLNSGEISYDELLKMESERGAGKLGSSGK